MSDEDISRANKEELERIKAGVAEEKRRLDAQIAKGRAEGKSNKELARQVVEGGDRLLNRANNVLPRRLRAINERQKTFNRATQQNITVKQSERIGQLAKQEGIKEYGTPAQRFQREFNTAPISSEPQREGVRFTDAQGNVFRGQTEPGVGLALGVREVSEAEQNRREISRSRSSQVLIAPPTQTFPVSRPRVFDEVTGEEVSADSVLGPSPDTFTIGTGANIVGISPTASGFNSTVEGGRKRIGPDKPFSFEGGTLSAAPEQNRISRFFTRAKSSFTGSVTFDEQTFSDVRNPERSGVPEVIGTLGGFAFNVATLTQQPLKLARKVFGGNLLGAFVGANVQGLAQTTTAEGTSLNLGATEGEARIVGNVAFALGGVQVFSEVLGQTTVKLTAGSTTVKTLLATPTPGVFASGGRSLFVAGSTSTRATLGALAGAVGGAGEGFVAQSVLDISRGEGFSPKRSGRTALISGSTATIIGIPAALSSSTRGLIYATDPGEFFGDVGAKGFGFGDELIPTTSATLPTSLLLKGVPTGSRSGTVTGASFAEPDAPLFGLGVPQVQSPISINAALSIPTSPGVSTFSLGATTTPVITRRSRTPTSQFSSPFTTTTSPTTPTTPITGTPIQSIPTTITTPTSPLTPTSPFTNILTTPRTTPVTNTLTQTFVPVTTARVPTLLFPFGSNKRARANFGNSSFARSRGSFAVPGLAAISLGITGRLSAPAGGFTGFEVRPLNVGAAPKKRKKAKKKKTAKKAKKRASSKSKKKPSKKKAARRKKK